MRGDMSGSNVMMILMKFIEFFHKLFIFFYKLIYVKSLLSRYFFESINIKGYFQKSIHLFQLLDRRLYFGIALSSKGIQIAFVISTPLG
ncbi:hypothetical protein W822_15585 [Advenella kashmirensis W13003]|uniref:Uncharacterized protein n=1 Tax=Advenella kashmirensis W13003 TaxID=1424334 RepID=V8QS06_9BURK|nr:hypothetical protein W822_15585 [Advenella kashmirensis W13003]